MAGISWIKLETTFPRKPVIFAVATMLGVDEVVVVGALVNILCWADGVTSDGVIGRFGDLIIDRVGGLKGLGEALIAYGWLTKDEDDVVSFCDWDTHNGENAKKRAVNARKVAKCKANKKVTENGYQGNQNGLPQYANSVTESDYLDKIREDNNNPQSPQGGIEVNYDSPENFVTSGGSEVKPPEQAADKGPLPYADEFEQFFKRYPKPVRGPVAKACMMAKWRRAINEDGYTGHDMLRALEIAMASRDWIDSNYGIAPQMDKWFDKNSAKRFIINTHADLVRAAEVAQESLCEGADDESDTELTDEALMAILD